jgi:hypothetical protein
MEKRKPNSKEKRKQSEKKNAKTWGLVCTIVMVAIYIFSEHQQ